MKTLIFKLPPFLSIHCLGSLHGSYVYNLYNRSNRCSDRSSRSRARHGFDMKPPRVRLGCRKARHRCQIRYRLDMDTRVSGAASGGSKKPQRKSTQSLVSAHWSTAFVYCHFYDTTCSWLVLIALVLLSMAHHKPWCILLCIFVEAPFPVFKSFRGRLQKCVFSKKYK